MKSELLSNSPLRESHLKQHNNSSSVTDSQSKLELVFSGGVFSRRGAGHVTLDRVLCPVVFGENGATPQLAWNH